MTLLLVQRKYCVVKSPTSMWIECQRAWGGVISFSSYIQSCAGRVHGAHNTILQYRTKECNVTTCSTSKRLFNRKMV